MTKCNVKGVAHGDEPSKNYHPTLRQLFSVKKALINPLTKPLTDKVSD